LGFLLRQNFRGPDLHGLKVSAYDVGRAWQCRAVGITAAGSGDRDLYGAFI
jgi:hypothetical protein